MQVTLTSEELAEFTPLNQAAMALFMQKSGSFPPPCWLCMSENARSEIRKALIAHLNEQMELSTPLTVETATTVVEATANIPEGVSKWKNAELALKRERENGNPNAYFANSCGLTERDHV